MLSEILHKYFFNQTVCLIAFNLKSVVELRKSSGGTTLRFRDFDAMYYIGVHNRSGGKSPIPSVIQALSKTTNYCYIFHFFEVS